MKRWAALTVLLYLATLAVLTMPVLLLAFGNLHPDEAVGVFQAWGYWVWFAVMGLGQALLLFVPVGTAERRPTPRRPLFVPILTAGFFAANIFMGAVLSLLCVVFKERAFDAFAFVGNVTLGDAAHNLVAGQFLKGPAGTGASGLVYVFGMVEVIGLLWAAWAAIFYLYAKADNPEALVKRTTRWLLRGSILELLVAVPSHIVVRNRDDCCAPMGTFWGITSGLSIMLLCFGPGVFFLFVERFGRLRGKEPPR